MFILSIAVMNLTAIQLGAIKSLFKIPCYASIYSNNPPGIRTIFTTAPTGKRLHRNCERMGNLMFISCG